MAEFGEQIGVVFQLSDDIIDITSDVTGKTPGTDLREGIPTLPTLLARKSTDPNDARLLELLDSDLHDDAALAEVLELLRRHCSIDQARAEVGRRAEQARALLEPLPARPGPRRPRGALQHRGHPLRLTAPGRPPSRLSLPLPPSPSSVPHAAWDVHPEPRLQPAWRVRNLGWVAPVRLGRKLYVESSGLIKAGPQLTHGSPHGGIMIEAQSKRLIPCDPARILSSRRFSRNTQSVGDSPGRRYFRYLTLPSNSPRCR